MTITDQQRREVAERLRVAAGGAYRHVYVLDVLCGETGVDAADMTTREAESAVYLRLADLIDRPTCRVESVERWETAGCGRGVDYELSCGHAATLGECNELRFCPVCGAEVVE